jgi:hypothetical protein
MADESIGFGTTSSTLAKAIILVTLNHCPRREIIDWDRKSDQIPHGQQCAYPCDVSVAAQHEALVISAT